VAARVRSSATGRAGPPPSQASQHRRHPLPPDAHHPHHRRKGATGADKVHSYLFSISRSPFGLLCQARVYEIVAEFSPGPRSHLARRTLPPQRIRQRGQSHRRLRCPPFLPRRFVNPAFIGPPAVVRYSVAIPGAQYEYQRGGLAGCVHGSIIMPGKPQFWSGRGPLCYPARRRGRRSVNSRRITLRGAQSGKGIAKWPRNMHRLIIS
jgi:hypothetical protein